jgi:transposase-like protein
VIELLRGGDLETLSRQYGVTAATISSWRDVFLAGGEAGLKSRETDVEDEEKQRLKSVVADLAMSNELLREKIRHLEQNRPLAPWKSKP